jgi:hypothetical protein
MLGLFNFSWRYQTQQSNHTAENDDRLETDGPEHPFDDLGFGPGDLSAQISTKSNQIGFGR